MTELSIGALCIGDNDPLNSSKTMRCRDDRRPNPPPNNQRGASRHIDPAMIALTAGDWR